MVTLICGSCGKVRQLHDQAGDVRLVYCPECEALYWRDMGYESQEDYDNQRGQWLESWELRTA